MIRILLLSITATFFFCSSVSAQKKKTTAKGFDVMAESFADLQVLRYQAPGFEKLSLQQKQLCYYLYQACLSGRDMIYDQKSKHGILMRKTIETMYAHGGEGADWNKFRDYCGRFWFSNGCHHHYGNEKFIPECSEIYFKTILMQCEANRLPLGSGETKEAFWTRVRPFFYDLKVEPKCVDLRADIDNVKASSNNFYEGVTQREVEGFYSQMSTTGDAPSWGLNSKLMKENGTIVEKIWKSGGMYSASINQIIFWLEKSSGVAENEKQRKWIDLLISFFKTGDLKTFDDYSVAWVQDTESKIDGINGFIEVYLDAIGKKGSYEAYVSMKDDEATKRIAAIAKQAQWFEDHSTLMPQHKKKLVKGIIAKAIIVLVESGDLAPSTAIGINLPNADWIRKEKGSKSVSLSNIIHSYNIASAKKGVLDEFVLDPEVLKRMKQYGALAADLHTDMHECIGHASGQINPGVETTDKTLKNYASCLEEARADLVGLYYIMDQKLIEIGVMPSLEVGKAEYDNYMINGLMTQLTRIKPGNQIEEAHMRNRQLIARWIFEKGKAEDVVVFVQQNGKTFVQINDYNKLRTLFGDLLREIQRIKSEGDFIAGKSLVEGYGVQVDPVLHKEVLQRYQTLGLKPYRGFIQPKMVAIKKGDEIVDVKIEYPTSFLAQMMEYGKEYSFLPTKN